MCVSSVPEDSSRTQLSHLFLTRLATPSSHAHLCQLLTLACCLWQGARGAGELWKGADAVVVDAGGTNEDVLYSKSAALQTWLLGYEFPDTIFIFCSRSIYVLSSAKKGAKKRKKVREHTTGREKAHGRDLRVCMCLFFVYTCRVRASV